MKYTKIRATKAHETWVRNTILKASTAEMSNNNFRNERMFGHVSNVLPKEALNALNSKRDILFGEESWWRDHNKTLILYFNKGEFNNNISILRKNGITLHTPELVSKNKGYEFYTIDIHNSHISEKKMWRILHNFANCLEAVEYIEDKYFSQEGEFGEGFFSYNEEIHKVLWAKTTHIHDYVIISETRYTSYF